MKVVKIGKFIKNIHIKQCVNYIGMMKIDKLPKGCVYWILFAISG